MQEHIDLNPIGDLWAEYHNRTANEAPVEELHFAYFVHARLSAPAAQPGETTPDAGNGQFDWALHVKWFDKGDELVEITNPLTGNFVNVRGSSLLLVRKMIKEVAETYAASLRSANEGLRRDVEFWRIAHDGAEARREDATKRAKSAESSLSEARKEAEGLREALEEIAGPIPFMRKRAQAEGGKLDGRMAVELAEDHNFLKSIARAALAASSVGTGEGKDKP